MRILRVRMWEHGHSFDEIDRMSLTDLGDVIGYWHEKNRIEEKLKKQRENLNGKNKGG